jgi:hypothetical protein
MTRERDGEQGASGCPLDDRADPERGRERRADSSHLLHASAILLQQNGG